MTSTYFHPYRHHHIYVGYLQCTPETHHVCGVHNVAAILWLRYMVQVTLFPVTKLCNFTLLLLLLLLLLSFCSVFAFLHLKHSVFVGYVMLQLFFFLEFMA